MTLEQYIKNLTDFAEKNPSAKKLEVVFRTTTILSDIHDCCHSIYEPKIGKYHTSFQYFIQEKLFDEHLLESKDINAVCVN